MTFELANIKDNPYKDLLPNININENNNEMNDIKLELKCLKKREIII